MHTYTQTRFFSMPSTTSSPSPSSSQSTTPTMPFPVSLSFSALDHPHSHNHPHAHPSSTTLMPSPALAFHNTAVSSHLLAHKQRPPQPRGLWKSHRGSTRFSPTHLWQHRHAHAPSPSPSTSTSTSSYPFNDDAQEEDYFSGRHSKRQRTRSPSITSESNPSASSSSSSDDEDVFWDYARQASTISAATTPASPSATPTIAVPNPPSVSKWTTRTKLMDISSTAGPGSITNDPALAQTTVDYEDWLDLKELFSKAAEQYETDDPSESLPILRGVIHESHRFLLAHEDPSVLFYNPNSDEHKKHHSSGAHVWRGSREQPAPLPELKEWMDFPPPPKVPAPPTKQPKEPARPVVWEKKCKCLELPTAFHAILGTALFLFGNLIAQDPSLALEGEPTTPAPYWLSAIDVFETGENLPSRTSGLGGQCEVEEDWRMAIVWGRTLVCIADEVVRRKKEQPVQGMDIDVQDSFEYAMSSWPAQSPFASIASRRPPTTRLSSLMEFSPNELMVLAMDQFSRGIFHMPHPQHQPQIHHHHHHHHHSHHHHTRSSRHSKAAASVPPPPPSSSTTPTPAAPLPSPPASSDTNFSRAKELYTIAMEVLLLSEKLDLPRERAFWAGWADSVFNQMKMMLNTAIASTNVDGDESLGGGGSSPHSHSHLHGHGGSVHSSLEDAGIWPELITRARGRCWLIVGSAKAEELEGALERGEMDVLGGDEADEAREALEMAVEYLEKAKGWCSPSPSAETTTPDESEERREVVGELKSLLAEALVTLGNLTVEEGRREELYKRAQEEGLVLDDASSNAGSDMEE